MASKATPRSPLIDKGNSGAGTSTVVHQMQETSAHQAHHPSMAYTILVDLINMVMSSAEIALVLYLSIHHAIENMGVLAVAMLAPILLNFVGVTYFFSDKTERDLFEKIGTTRLTKDMFQVPVFGPVFTAIKVLLISTGLSKKSSVEYERFEASAVKMRQAQTFFSAAPEAAVQLSVLLVRRETTFSTDNYLEAAIVIVSIFTLAEANVYALRSNYFRLFHSFEEGDWRVHESFGKKCILFLHSFCSIASRIAATACLIAGIHCFSMRLPALAPLPTQTGSMTGIIRSTTTTRRPTYPDEHAFANQFSTSSRTTSTQAPTTMPGSNSQAMSQTLGLMIGLTFICLILYHLIVYYVARLLRYTLMRKKIPGGCYESINYGWRSTLLHTGFQSKNVASQVWFYFENCAMFLVWWFMVDTFGNDALKTNTQIPITIIFTAFTTLSLFFLFAAVGTSMHHLQSPLQDKRRVVSIR